MTAAELAACRVPEDPTSLVSKGDMSWHPLILTFGYLCQLLFLSICVFLCRISSTLTAPHEGSPYLRTW
jgi:hypothetical protein